MKKYKINEDEKYYIICLVLCLLILLPLFIIAIYNRPSADDFSYSIGTHNAVLQGKSIFSIIGEAHKTNIGFYNSWQGLYSSAFLLALQPAIFGEKFYLLTGFIIIFSAYLFTFLSVNILNKMFLKKPILFSVTVSCLLTTMIMLLLPSAVQGIYWYNGAVNYMPWAFSNIFNICLILNIKNKIKSLKGIIYLVISIILAFLTSGGNHVTAFANILFLLIVSVYFLFKKKVYPLFPFVSACVGFVIMYMAPGTANRAVHFQQQSVKDTVVAVIKYLRDTADNWINVQWLLTLIIITPIAFLAARNYKNKLPKIVPIISTILSIGLICGMLAVPYFAMGYFGEPRVINVIWVTFMFLSWFNYILFIIAFAQSGLINCEKLLSHKKSSAISACVAGLGLFALVFTTGSYGDTNSYKAFFELKSGIPQAYAEEMDRRFEKFNDTSLTEVKVSPLKVKSEILFFTDVGTNPNEFPSVDISNYYGKTIYLVK